MGLSLVTVFRGYIPSLSLFSLMLALRLLYIAFIVLRHAFSIPNVFRMLIMRAH